MEQGKAKASRINVQSTYLTLSRTMMVKGEQGTGEDLHTRQCMYYGHERIGNFDTND